ncbi:hypothetical protein [Rhizobacter sp. Root1221]|uniref:LuxE/PaaK family acyltransferase n=1 Tax=Rhizobacter sp. Root1221 TaxID=1736433 RepID=UPI0006F63FE0|nr:hypothetical protein [Rhizobacter sp. Root1221]KQV90442.1 hypothetical protein ASC87_28245 [Rhizobacter sp. Root1221]
MSLADTDATTATASASATDLLEHRVEHEVLNATSSLDCLVFGADPFGLPLARQRVLRETHVRAALARHLAGCAPYAAFAERCGAGPHASLDTIPVIPTAAFKGRTILSVAPDEVVKWSLSSGTQGGQSRVGRDLVSVERLLGSVRAGIGLIESWHEDDVDVVHLGPSRKEAGDIWFLYVMSLIELLHPTTHHVVDGALDVGGAIDRIAELLRRDEGHVAVVGPPFRVMELVQVLGNQPGRVQAGNRLTVVTAGGWKRLSGQQIARDVFDARVRAAFGLAAPGQVRDVFNQVELNTVFFECSAHRKHVPPWVYATTRDPDHLAVQAPGTVGLLSYLDASASSYPSFLVTDDVGRVHEGPCGCGRTGATVDVLRRVTRVSARGCSLALDAHAAGRAPLEEGTR